LARDGRAGMAALVADEALDLAVLRTHLIERLPCMRAAVRAHAARNA